MLKNYFDNIFPKKQFIIDGCHYVFFDDGKFDTLVAVDCYDDVEDCEQAQFKVRDIIDTYGYSKSYDLFDAVISMEELLKYMDKAIDYPKRPECKEDVVSKERMVDLLRKMENMCDKLRNELDV